MTAHDGFTRLLDTWLAEEGVVGTPDYLGDVLGRTTKTKQRSVWRSTRRWLPMADIVDLTISAVPAPRVPMRAIVTVLLLVALVAAALVYVGSRARVPAPFGPARNGLVTWALDGDIYVGDPATGVSRRVVASDDIDRNPQFSRDGSRLAFLRQVPSRTGYFDLVVTDAEGNAPRTLNPVPVSIPESVQWTPDGTSLLVNESDGRLTRFFVDGAPAQLVLERVHLEPDAFRPPNGAEFLYAREDDQRAIYRMKLDGSDARQLFGARTAPCACPLYGPARWSPDGSKVAFAVDPDGLQARIFVIDAETGELRQLADQDGRWIENDPVWSPDGTRVAFNRWQGNEINEWHVRSIAIADVATGAITSVGVAPASEGALIEWAPDGRSILSLPGTLVEAFTWSPNANGTVARPTLINLLDGSSRQLDWSVGSTASWQRLAP